MARPLLSFDAFAKTTEDARVRTASGGMVTVIALLAMLWLIWGEWTEYRAVATLPELVVDKTRGDRMEINLNITFPNMPCELLTMDILDQSGEIQEEVTHGLRKTRLDRSGNVISTEALSFESSQYKDPKEYGGPEYCGPCYGAKPEGQCCNTCMEVKHAYAELGWAFHDGGGMEQCDKEHYTERIAETAHEGCNVAGHVSVNKVVGNFHFAPGAPLTIHNVHTHDISLFGKSEYEFGFTHIINDLSFGPSAGYDPDAELNPLDGVVVQSSTKHEVFQYFIKVVATRYERLDGETLETNQYAVTSHNRLIQGGRDEDHPHTQHQRGGIAGVYFQYDISPMKVINRERHAKSFGSFVASTCAIIGSVITFAAFVDRGVWEADKAIRRKKDM